MKYLTLDVLENDIYHFILRNFWNLKPPFHGFACQFHRMKILIIPSINV